MNEFIETFREAAELPGFLKKAIADTKRRKAQGDRPRTEFAPGQTVKVERMAMIDPLENPAYWKQHAKLVQQELKTGKTPQQAWDAASGFLEMYKNSFRNVTVEQAAELERKPAARTPRPGATEADEQAASRKLIDAARQRAQALAPTQMADLKHLGKVTKMELEPPPRYPTASNPADPAAWVDRLPDVLNRAPSRIQRNNYGKLIMEIHTDWTLPSGKRAGVGYSVALLDGKHLPGLYADEQSALRAQDLAVAAQVARGAKDPVLDRLRKNLGA